MPRVTPEDMGRTDLIKALMAIRSADTTSQDPGALHSFIADLQMIAIAALAKALGQEAVPPKYANTGCSQCGRSFGPGDHGYSHCEHHAGKASRP